MDSILKKLDFKVNIVQDYVKSKDILRIVQQSIYMLYCDSYFNNEGTEVFLEKILSNSYLDELDDTVYQEVENPSIVDEYKKITIDNEFITTDYDICDFCNNDIEPDSRQNNMLICNYCGYIKYLTTDNKSIPRSKIGNFKPQRHFKVWMERILGREPESEIKCPGMDIIEVIKVSIINKNRSLDKITIDDIRNVLKDINKTNLNKNTTLLAKKVTGRYPPYISDADYKSTNELFIKVMNARDDLTDTRCNRIYYPYYIYKIFNIILRPDQRKLTNYIHLHKNNTICDNDNEWRLICDIVPELNGMYTPTIVSNDRYI